MYIENLKKIRKILNLSVDELAKKLEIPARTIGGYERNERKMSLEIVTQLCKKLNVNANWFVTGKGEMFLDTETDTPGGRISDVQDKANISSHKMAELLNISESELSEIISDKIQPDLRVLTNLKKHFKVSMDYIMYGE